MKFKLPSNEENKKFLKDVNAYSEILMELIDLNKGHEPAAVVCSFLKTSMILMATLEIPIEEGVNIMDGMKEDYKRLVRGMKDATD